MCKIPAIIVHDFCTILQRMTNTKFKYNIQKLVNDLPRGIDVAADLLKKYGIPQRTFFSDKSLKQTDKREVSSHRLLQYADYFGVPVEQLINYTIRKKSRKLKTRLA